MATLSNLVILLCLLISTASCTSFLHRIVRRGIPVSGSDPAAQQRATAYAQQAGNEAISQIRDQERVSQQSASSAVGQAVGRDYSNQLQTTAQYVAQFTVPVTKDQAHRAFETIGNSQKASGITGALANSANSISHAASNAASSNYQQALQAQNAGYSRASGGGHGGGPWSSGGGGGSGGGPWSSGGGGGGGGEYPAPAASWA